MLTLQARLSFVIFFMNFADPILQIVIGINIVALSTKQRIVQTSSMPSSNSGRFNPTCMVAIRRFVHTRILKMMLTCFLGTARFVSPPPIHLFTQARWCTPAFGLQTLLFLPTNPGTIANTNYVGIAYNAKNLFGALVVSNEIASYAGQFSRRDPSGWGAGETYDPSSPQLTLEGWDAAFAFIDSQSFPPSATKAQLLAVAVPELDSAYQTQFQIDWQICIGGGSTAPPCQ